MKSTYLEIQDGGRPPNFQWLNRYNSAAYRWISRKFGREFDHTTANTIQMFKVKRSKVKITDVTRQQ